MSVFRLQNNVPQVYVDESRDFQTLCRAFDVLHGGVMYEISSMQNLTNPLKVKDSLLGLYATKVGFFTNRDIDAEVLRHIVATFPYMMKYKGTKIGIELAVASVLRAEKIPEYWGNFSVIITNKPLYTIDIYLQMEIEHKADLEEVLKYVIPTGYACKISSAVNTNPLENVIIPDGVVRGVQLSGMNQGVVRYTSSYDPADEEDRLKGAYDTNTVVTSAEITSQSQEPEE